MSSYQFSLRATSAALAFLVAAWPAAAQRVRGVVLDPATGGLAGATVSLRSAADRDSLDVVTDSAGTFQASLPAPGAWRVSAVRLGYEREGPTTISVAAGQEVELVIRLGARALQLAPVEVRGTRQVLSGREVVYERIARMRELGTGRAFTREEIERLNPQNLGSVLTAMSSQLRVVESPQLVVNTVFLRGGPQGSCPPAIFIDGFRVNQRPTNAGLLIEPRHVEAIELYTAAAQAPIGYHDPGGCGSILIWSRRGSPQDGPPQSWKRYVIAGALVLGAVLLAR